MEAAEKKQSRTLASGGPGHVVGAGGTWRLLPAVAPRGLSPLLPRLPDGTGSHKRQPAPLAHSLAASPLQLRSWKAQWPTVPGRKQAGSTRVPLGGSGLLKSDAR